MKKVKLFKLSRPEMSHVEINSIKSIRGGYLWEWPPEAPDVECGCNCLYADSGGSTIENNGKANMDRRLLSPEP